MITSTDKEHFDTLFCPIMEYFIDPYHKAKDISDLNVPVFSRVEAPIERCLPTRIRVDTGRTPRPWGNWKLASVDELIMQHYTCVRFNDAEIRRKYLGHGHLNRTTTQDAFVKKMSGLDINSFVKVPDYFGIDKYWRNEFGKYMVIV
jgi:hypothetical protein